MEFYSIKQNESLVDGTAMLDTLWEDIVLVGYMLDLGTTSEVKGWDSWLNLDRRAHFMRAADWVAMCYDALKSNSIIDVDGKILEGATLDCPLVLLAKCLANYAEATVEALSEEPTNYAWKALKQFRNVPESKLSETMSDFADAKAKRVFRDKAKLDLLWSEILRVESILKSDKTTSGLKGEVFPFLHGENKPGHVGRAATLLQACFAALKEKGIIGEDGTLVEEALLDCPLVLLAKRVANYAKATSKDVYQPDYGERTKELKEYLPKLEQEAASQEQDKLAERNKKRVSLLGELLENFVGFDDTVSAGKKEEGESSVATHSVSVEKRVTTTKPGGCGGSLTNSLSQRLTPEAHSLA